MAAPRGIDLTSDHARRVAAGEVPLSALAAELGCSRQSLFTAFRRRNWPTKAEPAAEQQPKKAEIAAKAPSSLVERQRIAQAPFQPPAPNCSPAASATPPAAILWPAATDTAEIVRHELANVALLALAQLRDNLAGQRLGPAALKSAAQAAQLVADVLDRAGVPISQTELPAPFGLVFEEMSEAECQAIQADAEAGYAGAFVTDDAI